MCHLFFSEPLKWRLRVISFEEKMHQNKFDNSKILNDFF